MGLDDNRCVLGMRDRSGKEVVTSDIILGSIGGHYEGRADKKGDDRGENDPWANSAGLGTGLIVGRHVEGLVCQGRGLVRC